MTPNTKNLDSGLLGIDNASARPRSKRSGGDDGFAEVFDAQVRGTERHAARTDRPDESKSRNSAEKAGADSSGASREAGRGKGRKDAEEAPRQTREAARTEAGAEEASVQETAPADDSSTGTESQGEMTSEQILAELNGNSLPVDEDGAAAGTVPEGAADATATAEADTSVDNLPGVTSSTATDVVDAEAEAGADLLAAANQRTAARERADGAAAAQQAKAAERPVDDLLAAFRFNRMMSQERGTDAPPRLDTAVLTEGQAPWRGGEALGMTGVAAVPGREAGGASAPVSQMPAANQTIAVPLNRPGWDQAFNERVVWMARQGIQEAHIQVNPREMGPIEVRVSVQNDQASVAFAAQNAGARDAIESALPRLREMLADSGLNLAQSEVSQQSPQERGDGRDHLPRGGGKSLAGSDEGVAGPVHDMGQLDSGRGMVDFFA